MQEINLECLGEAMNKVCVYGSLRKGMYNHVLMQNAIYLGDSAVQGATLYDMGAFPRIALPRRVLS